MEKTLDHLWFSRVTPIAYFAVVSCVVAYAWGDPVVTWHLGVFNTLLGVLYATVSPANKRTLDIIKVGRILRGAVTSSAQGATQRADQREKEYVSKTLEELKHLLLFMRVIGFVISMSGVAMTMALGTPPGWFTAFRHMVGAG